MDTRHVPTQQLCQEFDRRCKEKGIVVPQTEFYWCGGEKEGYIVSANNDCPQYQGVIYFPAPLVSELGEWLVPNLTPNVVIPNDFIPDHTGDFRKLFDPNYLIKLTNYLIAEGKITVL